MVQPYKHSYLLVMYNGKIVKWTGFATESKYAERAAIDYAETKHSSQVWDMCNRPVLPASVAGKEPDQ